MPRFFWNAFLWANTALIAGFWWNGSGSLLQEGPADAVLALARLAGLAAAYLVLLQFFFMGRLPWLERAFGLDRLSRIHHASGTWSIVLLISHPLLIILSYKAFSGLGFWGQLGQIIFGLEDALAALAGLLLFVAVVGLSIYIVRSRMRYESWYFVHLTAYAAVFLALGHQLELGHDLVSSRIFYAYWVALYTLVFGSHALFRFIRPAYLSWRHDFRVGEITRESPTAVSVYLRGRDLQNFAIRPGQFMIVRFFARGMWWQAHPFSLSMPPDGQRLRITVKELGDFTRRVKDIPTGTRVLIDGPYGVFTDLFSVSQKVLLVAGGIGITPVRSLMEEMLRKGKDVVLLYGNRTRGDIVFERELAELRDRYPARIIQVLSDDESYEGERGRIDREKIERLVPDLVSREVYLCGPPAMTESLRQVFRELGVGGNRLHYEKFSLP